MTKIELWAYYVPIRWNDHNEWKLLQEAKSYFQDHYQPRIPLHGEYDDNLLNTLKFQIWQAQKYGLDCFIFDRYQKRGELELNKPIENFLRVDTDMKFSVMWTWKTSKKDLPVMPEYMPISEQERWVETDKEDFLEMLKYCHENYFQKNNYRRVWDRPYFVLYFIEWFIKMLGREYVADMIKSAKIYFEENNYPVPYIVWVVTDLCDATDLWLDWLTWYNFLPDFSNKYIEKNKITQDYQQLVDLRIKQRWNISLSNNIKYYPSISVWRDATPRWISLEKLSMDLEFPRLPIIVNNTPENFWNFLKEGITYAKNNDIDKVHICAWNEWSEWAYLEPDVKFWYSYLEQILNLKDEK